MTNEEIIEQLENTIGLIKQNGKDWLDERDIPVLEGCIKSLTSLDKIKAEIGQSALEDASGTEYIFVIRVNQILDKYRSEGSGTK